MVPTGFTATRAPLPEGVVQAVPGLDGTPEHATVQPVTDQIADPHIVKKIEELRNTPLPFPPEAQTAISPTVPLASLPADQRAVYEETLRQAVTLASTDTPQSPPELPPEPPPADASAATGKPEELNAASSPMCKNCGCDPFKDITVEPTEDDKGMWLRHLLSGDRFIKEYSLLKGQVRVVLRSRLVSEQDKINAQLAADSADGSIRDVLQYMYWLGRYSLMVSLQSITIQGKTLTFKPLISADGRSQFEELAATKGMTDVKYMATMLIANWNDALVSALTDCVINFNMLCGRLKVLGRDENFF